MRIEDGAIREVVSKSDIATVIGSYVSLRKRGNDLVGLCPFHAEKSPSFHVHPDRGFFKCFGCGVGGDVIRFVSRIENIPFPEAVRALAKKAGVELEPETPAAARVRGEKDAIYNANAVAAAFFHRVLTLEPAGEAARAYCERRGLHRETIDRFMLGFAPDRWDALANELRRNGVDAEVAIAAGLLKAGQHGPYDFYRGRLIIPTRSTTGETIAFGGRALGDEEPKYLNTSTTPVYTKGRFLYALDIARRHVSEGGALIVVEGYLDCIALHANGFGNAVAALGTAFTADQAAQVRKYARNVFLCYDADAAGASATAKSLAVLKEADVNARIVRLPPGEDPDSFVRRNGAGAFTALLESAPQAVEYEIEREIERIRTGFASRAEIARNAEALVRAQPREEWDRYRVYVAQRLQVNVDDLRKSRFLVATPIAVQRPGGDGAGLKRPARAAVTPSFERDVLAIVLEEPSLLGEYVERIPPHRFEHPDYRRLYEKLALHAGRLTQPGEVLGVFAADSTAVEMLAEIAQPERSGTIRFINTDARREHLDRIASHLHAADERRRMQAMDRRIDELLAAGQPVPRNLRDEFAQLAAKLKK